MLPADIARCSGEHCSIREQCLRHTVPPVPDHPHQVYMESPHTATAGVECGLFMPDPEDRSRGVKS